LLFLSLLVAGVYSVAYPEVRSEDVPVTDDAKKAEESEAAKARFKFMMEALAEYKVEIKGEKGTENPQLLSVPALRWTNTVSGTKDGVVGVWTSGGRPEVVVQFAGYGNLWIHEFCSTSTRPFTMIRNGRQVWSPKAPGVTLRAVPKAPAPAETAVKRLIQMRQIAERFEIVDDFHPVYQDPKIERHTLRLLTKPLHRYDPAGDLIDGALFGLVITTDPEALLMIEEYTTQAGAEWRYGLAPMTVYGLTGKLDGTEVWNRPENRAWHMDDPYFVGAHK
jgi:hypothetical protein